MLKAHEEYGEDAFEAGIGAEIIRKILVNLALRKSLVLTVGHNYRKNGFIQIQILVEEKDPEVILNKILPIKKV